MKRLLVLLIGLLTALSAAGTSYVGFLLPSGTTPLILYTDIDSGPTTGGLNNKGAWLSVFGKNLGATLANVKVYVNNVEVDTYVSLGTSRGRSDIQQVTTQVGALGSPTAGTPLAIKVTVSGTQASNPNSLTFTAQPGTIRFVSLTGDDTTGDGSAGNPYRHAQLATNNGSATNNCVGYMQPGATVPTNGVWGVTAPGDFIVLRGGTWTDVYNGSDPFFMKAQNKSGSVPTGSTGTGPITIMGYPGEDATISETVPTPNTATSPGGGISSADSTRQAQGCGARVTITNLLIDSGRNDGVISQQRGADNVNGSYWRVVNNDLAATTGGNNENAKGAGVSGSGTGSYWVGNKVHDIGCCNVGGFLQNHGFYIDSDGTYEIAYNWIKSVTGGNGLQTFVSSSGNVHDVNFHHNYVDTVSKHGLNIADGTTTALKVWDNVILNVTQSGLRFNTNTLSGALFYNNTFYNLNIANNGNRSGLENDWNFSAGALELRNNIFDPVTGAYTSGTGNGFSGNGTFTNNLFFGGTGTNPASSWSTSSQSTNPSFVSTTPGSENLAVQAGSPAIGNGTSAVSGTVSNDYLLVPRPVAGTWDIGAYEQ